MDIKKNPDHMKDHYNYKYDKEIWDQNYHFRHFLGYYLNFIGIFMPPIFTFKEYRHLLLENFSRKSYFTKTNLKQLFLIFLFMFANFMFPKFWDFNLSHESSFQNYSIGY